MDNKSKKSNVAHHKPSSNKKRHHSGKLKKEKGVVPYITTPLIYILIALVVVLPLFIGFANRAVNTVHEAQETYALDYSDIEVNSERFDSKALVYDVNKISECEKVGRIKCEKVGINSDVYFGVNRVSLRNGAGLSTKSSFNDAASKLNIAGYSTRAFKGLDNISVGDVITFETTDKVYEYKVQSNEIGLDPSVNYSSGLILSSDEEGKAFSALNSEKRYVVASFSSVRDRKGE